MRVAVLVALISFVVYMGSLRTMQSIDSNTNALLAYSLVRDRDVYLDEFADTRQRISYWSFVVNGHEIAPYPPGTALLAVPFVAVGLLVGIEPPQTAAFTIVAKSAAALAASASVGVVFLLAARVAGRRLALVVAALYAFGTVTWPISAGALWQHGPAQLFLALGLLMLYPRGERRWRARAGLAFGLATLCRLTDGAFALAALFDVARQSPRLVPRFLLWASPAVALLLVYDVLAFGRPIDLGYLTFNYTKDGGGGNLLVGLAGNLIAPDRGLFVYSPFLIFGVYELIRLAIRGAGVTLAFTGSASLVLVVYAASVDWWGGFGYGNRYLADALPLMSLGLAFWLRRMRANLIARVALVAAGVWSVAVAALGALVYDWAGWSWESLPGLTPQQQQWSLDPPQILYTALNAGARVDAATGVSLAFAGVAVLFFARLWLVSGERTRSRRPLR